MAKKMKKKIIHERIPGVDQIYLDYTYIGVVIDNLNKIKERAEELGYSDIIIEDTRDSYDGEYSTFYVFGDREETDEEYYKRIGNDKAFKERILEEERAEYERLKKKFGDK